METSVASIRVQRTEDGRGQSTVALRDFESGEVLIEEPCLAVSFESLEPSWAKSLRSRLKELDPICAWQYCLAVRCLPMKAAVCWDDFEGLRPLSLEESQKLQELCGDDGPDDPISALALCCAEHLKAPELAKCLDDLAARVARNGFQVVDLKAKPPCPGDALFHRVSFFNHCCAGLSNATWTWKREKGLTVKTTRPVMAEEELTISYISKPWCDMARPARRKYLKQNFNFFCLCKACVASKPDAPAAKGPSEGKKGLAQLLLRWMKEGDDDEVLEVPVSVPAIKEKDMDIQGGYSAPQAQTKEALSMDQRVDRLLGRCEKENLEVSPSEAMEVLQQEEGHVGKSMIRLRRDRKSVV